MVQKSYVVKKALSQSRYPSFRLHHIDIELTERCNNACIHCLINRPENDREAKAREMDTAAVKNVLTQAAELGSLTVRFTGGEPLLRADFQELYLFARQLGMYVILFTNARLITPEIAALFSRIPPGREIEISVYGMRPSSYDAAAATRGAFAEFWRGIELLREYHIPFIVKQSVLPPNRDEIQEFEAFAASLPSMKGLPGYAMNFELRARRDHPAKNKFIQGLRLTPAETIEKMVHHPDYIKNMPEFASKFMGPPGERLFSCGAGLSTCVDAYGNAQMCMGLRHPDTVFPLNPASASHLFQELDQSASKTLEAALTDFFPRIRELKATNPDYLERCSRCFIKGLCEQCPAKSWQEHGTLDTPVEYFCQVAHAQACYLGLLTEDEKAWVVAPEIWQARLKHFISSGVEET